MLWLSFTTDNLQKKTTSQLLKNFQIRLDFKMLKPQAQANPVPMICVVDAKFIKYVCSKWDVILSNEPQYNAKHRFILENYNL